MRTATNKKTGFLFLLLGFTPLLFVVFFIVKQQLIRHHMKERMEEQLLHTVTLADNEVHWIETGREILVQGKMFDVKSVDYKNGTTTFHGLFDEEETNLARLLNTGWKKNLSEQNQLLIQFFQCLQGIYSDPPSTIIFFPGKQQHIACIQAVKPLSQFMAILTPPPQV